MANDTATLEGVVEHKRATVRPDKGDAVAALTESFTSSSAAVLTEYRGLTVKQISELRRALGADTTYSVVKNTLSKIAAANAGLSGLDALLSGPTAVAFVGGDPVSAAKSLRDFAKTNPALVVKGGVMDGKTLTADEIKKLADLESREVLLAKLAGAMKASLTQAVYLFAAPLSQAARAIGALQAKVAEGSPELTPELDPELNPEPAPEASTEAPAAEETAEAPAAEETAEAPAAEETAEASSEAPAAEESTENDTAAPTTSETE